MIEHITPIKTLNMGQISLILIHIFKFTGYGMHTLMKGFILEVQVILLCVIFQLKHKRLILMK